MMNETLNKEEMTCWEKNYGKNILPLSTFDNENFPGTPPLEILVLYKKTLPILKLRDILFKTIEVYNLFSSRLIMIGDNKFALQYCTDGVIANPLPPVDARYEDIHTDELIKRMVHVKTLPGEPLFAVTGIPLRDGILTGISCSHAVTDGISLLLFLYALVSMIEGKNFLLPSPQRLFKGRPIRSDQIDKALVPPLSSLSDEIRKKVETGTVSETFTVREYFTDDFLNQVKDEAKSKNAEHHISNHQIMTSFLLKKYHHQMLPNSDRIVLKNPINLRDIHPDIHPLYIGSANFNNFVEFTKDEIDRLSIPQVALRIKEAIAGMRNEQYAREIVCLSEYGIEINMDVFRKNRPPYNVESNVVSSNLTHLNDLESMLLGTDTVSILHIGLVVQTGFTMVKEKNGHILAQITSRYPVT